MTRALALLALTLSLTSGLAFAQHHGEPAAPHETPAIEPGEHGAGPLNWANFKSASIPVLAMLFNFAVLGLVLWKLLRKPLSNFLLSRHEAIRDALDDARQLRAEAEARYREYSEKLTRLDEDIARLRAEMRVAGEAERDRIVQEANERSARLGREAEFLLKQEIKQTRIDLERELAIAAVSAAEETLKRVTEVRDQERLAEQYLGSLRGAAEQGGAGQKGGTQ